MYTVIIQGTHDNTSTFKTLASIPQQAAALFNSPTTTNATRLSTSRPRDESYSQPCIPLGRHTPPVLLLLLFGAFAPPTINKKHDDAQPQDSGASRHVLGDASRSRHTAHRRQLGFKPRDGARTTAADSSSGTAGLLRRQCGVR